MKTPQIDKTPYGRTLVWLTALPVLVAVLALIGWATGFRFLTSLRDTYFPMPPSTAVGLIVTAASLWTLAFWPANLFTKAAGRIGSLALMILGLIVLYEFVAEISPGIEERLSGISGELNGIPLGRMSPIAAALFVLANLALILNGLTGKHKLARNEAALLGLGVMFVGGITTLGYLYGTPLLYGGSTRPVAPTAGFSFLFLGAAIVLLTGPGSWPLRNFVGNRVQPRLLRTFLPIALSLIVAAGWLQAVIPENFDVNPVYLSAILAIVFIAPATLLISRSARRIGGEIDRANAEREKAEAQVIRTLSELERANLELERSNAELEQFAYVASHDLQEPLRTVTSFLQLLEKRYQQGLDDEAREFIGFAVDGARRMQALIDDLLRLSRVGTRGQPFAALPLDQALADAEANLSAAIEDAGARITHDPLPVASVDRLQLMQLFQNLLENAIKFRGPEPPRIHISCAERDTEWEICVRDNGKGFEQKYADRIFVIFQRLQGRDDYQGTGIGLAVAKKIVERHGGRIRVTSQPGVGSVFCFTVPRR